MISGKKLTSLEVLNYKLLMVYISWNIENIQVIEFILFLKLIESVSERQPHCMII